MTQYTATIHAPEFAPRIKHQMIFMAFDQLIPGEHMLLINDHDPVPLHYQFEHERAGMFTWEYIKHGPVQFQVNIGRI